MSFDPFSLTMGSFGVDVKVVVRRYAALIMIGGVCRSVSKNSSGLRAAQNLRKVSEVQLHV